MLKIRLRRMGAKHAAFYRIVVSDSRSTPRGRFVETVGTYDPATDPAAVKLDVERTEDWIRKGATRPRRYDACWCGPRQRRRQPAPEPIPRLVHFPDNHDEGIAGTDRQVAGRSTG